MAETGNGAKKSARQKPGAMISLGPGRARRSEILLDVLAGQVEGDRADNRVVSVVGGLRCRDRRCSECRSADRPRSGQVRAVIAHVEGHELPGVGEAGVPVEVVRQGPGRVVVDAADRAAGIVDVARVAEAAGVDRINLVSTTGSRLRPRTSRLKGQGDLDGARQIFGRGAGVDVARRCRRSWRRASASRSPYRPA